MSNLTLTISHSQHIREGHRELIRQSLVRSSSAYTRYTAEITHNIVTVLPTFKSEAALKRVSASIFEILAIKCEEMDPRGQCCAEHYNCCDCGNAQCGCPGCYSCRACDSCLAQL